MAKSVASDWIQKHASKRFCLTVYFPSDVQARKVRRIARFAVSKTETKNARVEKIEDAILVPGIDSLMIVSDDETNMELFKTRMEKMGFEVGWGW